MKHKQVEGGTIYLGDCLKLMRKLPENSVDLVFGSPPYEDQRTYGIGFKLKGQDWVDWMVEVIEASLRVSKGLVAFVVGHGNTKKYKWSATPALLIADLHRKGICLRDPVWYKRVGIPGSGGPDYLRKDIEFIVCATSERGRLPWSDIKAVSKPWRHKPGGKMSHRDKDGNRVNAYKYSSTSGYKDGDTREGVVRVRRIDTDHANPGNVVEFPTVGGGHLGSKIAHENEAPFPEPLAAFFVKAFCPLDGIVLDPFGGSGTTAAAAVKNGRRFITCDIRKSQVRLIERRIKAATTRKGFGL